ncbi:putative radial spokehead-like 3 [Operophtera brumata]|uniref:Putative radial spokehead-like 3 n=1 Tax=Operophtera brumata TaxID=104452 RepID=A0A0L7KQL0_OPEBR|nr:putative radial spokehead-like 3 [Operophtera brumata]
MEEGGGDMAFNPNPFFRGHTLKDLLDTNLTYWVHHGRHILKQGRTIWWNPNAGMTGPPLFTPLAEDERVEGLNAWTARVSTKLAPDRALAVLRSSVWPGAVPNFSPLQLPQPQDEYPIGPEVMEMADPTFADEEVCIIVHGLGPQEPGPQLQSAAATTAPGRVPHRSRGHGDG